ncbi:hypothetical protein J4G07_20235 [Candidatus Poribacteria bacterium]|nr:hypothetical protein [Candidatus Poribacteria bacterium]
MSSTCPMTTARNISVVTETHRSKPHIWIVQLVYLTQHHPVEELYDMTTDPYEFNNLAFRTEMRPILEEMRADVRHWMHAQDDEGRHETCNLN